jgi:lipid II:glycine glycyltransferase (peptidoglycan interpeptide bridge formation enzyme)
MSNRDIRLVKNKDIDYHKWDQCIARSAVPLVYAQSWYLDLVSPNWDAMIKGDYAFVMPLGIQRKLGISFLLQPTYAQQHGIFPEPDQLIQNTFLTAILDQFKYVTVNLNASHSGPFPEGFRVQERDNFILQLSPSEAELKVNYSKHTRRQIRKAEDNKVFIMKGLPTSDYFDLKIAASKTQLIQRSMQTLKRVMDYAYSQGSGMIYGAYNQHNTLCAAAFFLFSGQRVTYLNAVSNDEGKDINAMHKIVDQFIQEHSGKALTLDFEGSVIPGIARFYKGFGAETEQYYCLKSNRLPVPLRWFKK